MLTGLLILIPSGYIIFFKFINKPVRKSIVILPNDFKADSIVVFKNERKMVLHADNKPVKDYRVSLGKNPTGRKEKEGDKKTPEGFYKIDYRNPNSKYHLSLHISYPGENDKLRAAEAGVNPGGDIMIHGLPNNMGFLEVYFIDNDWTDGCIAVTNEEIEEIWRVVDDGVPIMINP